jgi:MFS-type transporter involved in bile tolerance (Atg22 family)
MQEIRPEIIMILLAVSHAVITTFTLAGISRLIPWESAGKAFGMVEILDAILNFVSNLLFGWAFVQTGSYEVSAKFLMVISYMGSIIMVILCRHLFATAISRNFGNYETLD